MKLHSKQWTAFEIAKTLPMSAYVGGIRSGKTIVGAHFALDCIASNPDSLLGIFSNTNKQLEKATLKEFKGVLESYGIREYEHYVVNKNPENFFTGYKSKFTAHDGIWSFWNGKQVFTFSLETQIRGIELGEAWGDEVQDSKIDELYVVLGRMSGSKTPRTFYTLTPPADNPEIDELIYGDKAIPVTFGTTYDNIFLEKGYVEMLKSTYSPLTFAREVLCERKPMSGLNWLYVFDKNRHVSEKAAYQPNQIVYLSFDFNNNPFVCTMAHRGAISGKKHGYIHYFDTVVIEPDNVVGRTYVEAICEAIMLKCPNQWRSKAFIVTGDASGASQSVLKRVGENVWTDLVRGLGIATRQLRVSKSNPRHSDSRELCNAVFQNFDEVLINPKNRELIRDCEFVKAKPDGSIVKDNRKNIMQQADLLDALRYDINAFNNDFIRVG